MRPLNRPTDRRPTDGPTEQPPDRPHYQALFGAFGFNLAVGFAVSVLPVYHACTTLLGPVGGSAYHSLSSVLGISLTF